MNKTEFIAKVAETAGVSNKEAASVVSAALEVITSTIAAGDSVALTGFGTFSVRESSARTGKNPRTGETIEIAARKVPAFKAGKALKDSVQ